MPSEQKARILLYIQAECYVVDGQIYCEAQACNGLGLWADNFEHVTVMCPSVVGPPPSGYRPVEEIRNLERIKFELLPRAYHPKTFATEFLRVRRRISKLSGQADYRCFAIGGLIGDWGLVACLVAHAKGEPYAVWTARVESDVTRVGAKTSRLRRRLFWSLALVPAMAWFEKRAVRCAHLGLFQGQDTYDAFSRYNRQPQLTYSIHMKKSDHINPTQLEAKVKSSLSGPLKIIYAGRADPMKGALDWLQVLRCLDNAGVPFEATWLGDGEDRATMLREVKDSGLQDWVALPGTVTDRAVVLDALRESHIFLFCHKTRESSRVLLEALASGVPIVGYDSAFARELISPNDGGILTPMGNIDLLASAVVSLNRDRVRLGSLIDRAAKDGSRFVDSDLFRDRSDLIRQHA